jgi:putative ABC transport system permease protein
LMDRLRALPNVEALGMVGLGFLGERRGLIVPAIRRPEGSIDGDEHLLPFSGDLFAALGVKLIQGRFPTEAEVQMIAPVVLVSEQAARRLWPGRSALGQTLIGGSGAADIVIGVVSDAKYGGLDAPSDGQIYKPTAMTWPQVTIGVRSRGRVADTLRETVHQVTASGPSVSLVRAQTLRDALEGTIRLRTFRAWLFGIFAVGSLLLTCTGIIGTMLMATALRARETAIRLALGAKPRHILTLLTLEPIVSLLVGGLAGAGITIWLVRFARPYLFQVDPYDPRLWAVIAIALTSSTLLATLLPAIRLTRVDVTQILKAM